MDGEQRAHLINDMALQVRGCWWHTVQFLCTHAAFSRCVTHVLGLSEGQLHQSRGGSVAD